MENSRISNSRKVFIIMPFAQQFDKVYELLKNQFLKLNYEVYRADEIYHTNNIMDVIFKEIENCSLVIADVTGKSPNVNYELGICHALHKPTIIISQNRDDVPFDYQHRQSHIYDMDVEGWEKILENQVMNTYNSLPKGGVSKVWEDSKFEKQDDLHKFLLRTYQSGGAVLENVSIITSDDKGNVYVDQERIVRPKAHLSNIYHEIYIDKPGKIRIDQIYDVSYGSDLPLVLRDYNETKLRFFILFRDMKDPDSIVRLKIKYLAENYLSDLFDKGEAISFHKNTKSTNVEMRSRKEIYRFPVNNQTKRLRAVYLQHPVKDEVGKIIKPTNHGDYLELILNYFSGGQTGFQSKLFFEE